MLYVHDSKAGIGIDMDLNYFFKDIAKDLFYYLGLSRSLFWISRFSRYPKWLIFTYHRISCASRNNDYLSVPSDAFEKHVRFMKDNFKTVSMLDGLKALQKGDPKEIYATINLDDGYMDNYLYAYPILKKYHVPATIFLTTDFIGKSHVFWWDRVFKILDGTPQRSHAADSINGILKDKNKKEREDFIKDLEARYPSTQNPEPSVMLGWDEIKKMQGSLISFGAHTKTHRDLCTLDDDEALRELAGSKKEIEEKLGTEIAEFSYPFGTFDERVKALVKKAGFAYARTSLKGFNRPSTDRFLLTNIGTGSLLKVSFLASRVCAKSLKSYIYEKDIFS